MEAIGALGAIAGIIDVATRSISKLADLRKRFREIDFAVGIVCGRIVTIKAALEQIHALISETFQQEQHYQLVMNLDSAIKCCYSLIRKLDEQISNLEYKEESSLNFASRIKMTLESQGMEQCLRMLDGQMASFTCLITALNTRDMIRQRDILKEKHVTRVFDKMRDDSSSLYVLCDSASFTTRHTTSTISTSKYSINSFDIELLRHKAYKNTLRALLRKGKFSSGFKENAMRSEEINKLLRKSSYDRRGEARVLVAGQSAIQLIRSLQQGTRTPMSQSDRLKYRLAIYARVVRELRDFMDMLYIRHINEATDPEPDLASLNSSLSSLVNPPYVCLDTEAWAELAETIHNSIFSSISLSQSLILSQTSKPRFIDDLRRVLDPDFIPTDNDINLLPLTTEPEGGILRETCFESQNISYRMIQHPMKLDVHRKVFHLFSDVTATIYPVDLCCYDEGYATGCNIGLMTESLAHFDAVFNSHWFENQIIIVLLMNVSEFQERIATKPMRRSFPDYLGGDDLHSATEYLAARFGKVNRNNLRIYCRTLASADEASLMNIFCMFHDIIIDANLRLCGLI